MADYKEESLDEVLEEDVKEPEAETPKEEPKEPEPETDEAEDDGDEEEQASPQVPLAALKKEREQRKADGERLKALEAEIEALKTPQQQKQEQKKAPDMFEDPEGYNAYWEERLTAVQQSNQQSLVNERLNISERYAVKEHGGEMVEQAKQWALERAQRIPGYQAEILNQPDPYEFVVQEYNRDQFASSVTADEFEQFKAWKAGQETEPAPKAPSTTANRRSVARKAPEPFDTDEALEDILNKK